MFLRTLHKEAKIRMHPSVILYPVLVQVLLTLIVYVRIGMVKTRAAATWCPPREGARIYVGRTLGGWVVA